MDDNNNNQKLFGEFIKNKRKQKELTLVELKELTGLSQPYLSQIENGSIPSLKALKKLTVPLEIPYVELLNKAGYKELNNVDLTNENIDSEERRFLYLKLLNLLEIISYENKFYGLVNDLIKYLEDKYEDLFNEEIRLTPNWLKEKVLTMEYDSVRLFELVDDLVKETAKISYEDWMDRLPDDDEDPSAYFESVEKHARLFDKQIQEQDTLVKKQHEINSESQKKINDDIGLILRYPKSMANFNGIELTNEERTKINEYIEFLLHDQKGRKKVHESIDSINNN